MLSLLICDGARVKRKKLAKTYLFVAMARQVNYPGRL